MVGGTADNMVQLKKGSLTRLCRSGLVQDNDAVTLVSCVSQGMSLHVTLSQHSGVAFVWE